MRNSIQLVERHPGVVDLSIRSNPGVLSYTIGAAATLNAAYAGTTPMFTVPRGGTFTSLSLQRSRINRVEESNRGLTRASYDPGDYASATIPGEGAISFVRSNPTNLAGISLGEGPILVVPPPGFFGAGRRTLALSGTAPNVAALPSGLPPAASMAIDFPKFAEMIRIYNDGLVSIFLALGPGEQEFEIPPAGGMVEIKEAGVSGIFLRAAGGTSAFRILTTLVQGIQA
jgi:hypothetical protein